MMSSVRTIALAATAWAGLGFSGHLAPANAEPAYLRVVQAYPDSTDHGQREMTLAARPMPRKMNTWDNVVISRKIGDCGNRCRAGIAE